MNEQTLFAEALERTDPRDRAAFLDQACQGDPAPRARIERLLAQHQHAGDFLEVSPQAPAATLDEPVAEHPGTVIGPYKLIERIGEGGMGTVWMAQQTEPVKRLVALKLIKAGMDSKQVIARFEAERQALALMDHANIAKVLDGGTTGIEHAAQASAPAKHLLALRAQGRPYFVMELVKGVPITKYCDEHHLTPRQRLELFIPVCQAVQHAHQKGIIHRDLKPSNVLVALYDGRPVPKVIDFGVAKAAGQPLTDKTLVTGFGNIVGTLEYMSPEQAEINQLDIDTRSDIYSLGVLLYELLTGSPPFSRKELTQAGLLEMLRVIREQEPSKPSTKLSTAEGLPTLAANRGTEPAKLTKLVRGELDWIVMKALEKDRNRRYETANGFAMDVQRYLADEAVQACPPSMGYRFRKFARRNKAGLAVAALILFFTVLLGSGVGWVVRDREAREQELAREREARQAKLARQREARQTKLAGEMRLTLERAELFQGEGKRAEALAAYERAEMLAAEAAPEPVMRGRLAAVKERLDGEARDQEFVARFEETRLLEQSRVDEQRSHFTPRTAFPKIREALGEYGIEVGITPAAETVTRIQARPEFVQRHLVAALHECLRLAPQADASSRRWLTAVLDSADSDRWRQQARRAWAASEWPSLKDLARKVEMQKQPPSFLLWVAEAHRRKAESARLELLRRIRRAYPGDFWANHQLAYVLKDTQPAEAVRYYTAALALRPHNPGVYLNRAKALQGAGELDAAIADLRQAVVLAPRYAAAHYNLGIALKAKGKSHLEEAIAAYHKALEIDPKSATAHNNLGTALRAKGDLKGAIHHYRQAIAIDPKYAAAHNNLGNALKAKGKSHLEEAIAAYHKALEIDPKSATAHNNLGLTLKAKGDLKGAIHHYRQAIAIDPKYAMAHCNLGNALVAKGDLKGAIGHYRQAIAIDPKHAMVHVNLERALLALGLWKEAAASISERLNNGSASPTEHSIALAGARLLLGDVEGYQELCRKMLPHLEKTKGAYTAYILSRTYALSDQGPGDAAQTLHWAEKAVTVSKSAWHLHALGRAHLRAGQFDQAIQQCQESLKQGPRWQGRILNWLILALAHHNLGQAKEAGPWLHKAEAWRAELPTGEDGKPVCPPTLHVADWVEFHVLYREAKALLKAPIEKK